MSTRQPSDLATEAILNSRRSPHRNNTIDPDQWFSIGHHVFLAALQWPVVVYLAMAIASVVAGLIGGSFADAADFVGLGALGLLFAIPAAGVATIFAAGMSLLFAILVYGSLRVRIPMTLVGAVLGGWIGGGYMALAIDFERVTRSASTVAELASLLFLLVSATVMGQYGGAIGGWKATGELLGSPYFMARCQELRQRQLFRFSIRDMLVGSAWICGVLGVLNVVGLLTPRFATSFGVWAATQTVTLCVGIVIWPRYIVWRVRRAERRSQ